jgi:streptogramin lyase
MRVPSLPAAVFVSLSFALTGCGIGPIAAPTPEPGLSLHGNVHGGQQPVTGAHVYLFAINTTGNAGSGIAPSAANASISLLTSATGYSDSIGNYVPTDNNGNWSINNDYTCTLNQQVYLYALGGDTGSGPNSAAGMLAPLGICPATGHFSSTAFIWINEVSTIATAYALSGFATDATHISSSGTPLALTGVANAVNNIGNLVDPKTGNALDTTPAGNGVVASTVIDTLADILASCVNATDASPAPCTSLFALALNNAATPTAPTDTATAAINIAHNPGTNVTALFNLVSGIGSPYPGLRTAPNDFTISISFYAALGDEPNDFAIDAGGNVWIADTANNRVVELNPLGVVASGSGYTGGGNLQFPFVIAVDNSSNIWVANYNGGGSSVIELTTNGGVPSGVGIYSGGGLNIPTGMAIDGSDNVWIANNKSASVTKISGGAIVSPGNGYPVPQTQGMAIDAAGHPWVDCTGQNLLFEELSPTTGAIIDSAPGRGGIDINLPRSIAIDANGNAWIVDNYTTDVIEEANAGGTPPLSGYFGYAQGAFVSPSSVAIDGAGKVWVSDYQGSKIVELDQSGNVLSGANGFTGSKDITGPFTVALDGSGDLWTISFTSFNAIEFIGLPTPVVTPLARGVKNNTLGSRP